MGHKPDVKKQGSLLREWREDVRTGRAVRTPSPGAQWGEAVAGDERTDGWMAAWANDPNDPMNIFLGPCSLSGPQLF